MSKKLNLSNMLDFSEIDLTAPDNVVEEILKQLPEETHDIIFGKITSYEGYVTSYTTTRRSISEALGTITAEKYVDIQNSLGKSGEEERKFECFLYTPGYEKYKYRMFFMKYGIANYPVQFTLEESIARNIHEISSNYIVICNNRDEVETLLGDILTSEKVINVMQELIRIFQAKKKFENHMEMIDIPFDEE